MAEQTSSALSHWASPPFAGCISVILQSALQANICSVVSDTTSLLFAQVFTSVPWTLCSLHPHPGVFKQIPSHKGMDFVRTAILHAFLPWPWQTWRKKRPPRDRDVQAVKPTWSICNKRFLAGEQASWAQHRGRHQEVKRKGRHQICFPWTFV